MSEQARTQLSDDGAQKLWQTLPAVSLRLQPSQVQNTHDCPSAEPPTEQCRTLPWAAASSASGMSSANTIHTMQPAAKPSASGSMALKAFTNMKLGTATSGCGRLHSIALHREKLLSDILRFHSTMQNHTQH